MNARRLLSLCLALVLCLSAGAWADPLQPGATAPDFSVQASHDGVVSTFALKKAHAPVVVYFFPSAFTYGCDIEAHTFATHKAQFDALGATIIGISADSLTRLKAFSKDPDFCAGQFPVGADPDASIAQQYGLKPSPAPADLRDANDDRVTHVLIPRTTFVINDAGKIVKTLSSANDGLSPQQHVLKALAIAQALTQDSHS